MADFLLVPIQVEALFIPVDQVLTEASADFTRTPYCNSQRDINADVAYLSEEIVSHPFQNQNFTARAGVHLHWFLPSPLTDGRVDDQQTTFPAVPNRWLVTRLAPPDLAQPKLAQKQWMVESDFLHPEGQGEGSVVFPLVINGPRVPFRRLGRTLTLEEWLRQGSLPQADYLSPLTAVGYGELTFAAFYPNCHSVFGFWDGEISPAYPEGLTYLVIGFYSSPEKDDFLKNYLRKQNLHSASELAAALKLDFAWDLPLSGNEGLPQRMVCYGAAAHPVGEYQGGVEKIAIANNGVEALAAYLADGLAADSQQQKIIFAQLEYLASQAKLADHRLDLDARYQESCHERSFNAVTGGVLWTVRPKEQPASPTSADLPLAIATLLDGLNQAQQEYDQQQWQLAGLRQQLFSDWYKYMLCVYPPEGASDDYPDIDEVKHFIETRVLSQLEQATAVAIQLEYQRNRQRNGLQQFLLQANQYLLEELPASRYWEPKEPVVLIVDDLGAPLLQPQAEPLTCQIVAGAPAGALVSKMDLDALLAAVRTLPAGAKALPWHSIFLEWQVQYFPVLEGNNVYPLNRDFQPDYLTSSYTLATGRVELTQKPGTPTVKGAQLYSGCSLLTPNAGLELEEELIHYFYTHQDLLGMEPVLEEKEAFQAWLLAQLDELLKRDPAARPEHVSTFLGALKAIRSRLFLSQALSGFNEALLMHKQTLQLPIADPLGFAEYLPFTTRVAAAVGGENKSAPQPLDDFNPIRAGGMSIFHLRLIDTFGRVKELYPGRRGEVPRVVAAEEMRPPAGVDFHALLAPRLVQPARLQLRWLDAASSAAAQPETNAHPATSPVCGWLLPNHLDQSILFYDQAGAALGSLRIHPDSPQVQWDPAPGAAASAMLNIANPHLRSLAVYLQGKDGDAYDQFHRQLASTLENIAPENYRQDIGLSLLVGRPVAVVCASLKLELMRDPAIHQGWNAFRRDLAGDPRGRRDTNSFEQVNIPIRLGDLNQLDDGLIAYWQEQGGQDAQIHFCGAQGSADLPGCVGEKAKALLLLIDPRGKVHATCGILPAKAIDLPAAYYADVLKNLEVTFLTAPILTNQLGINLPVPAEAGYRWTWVDLEGTTWQEKAVNLPENQDTSSLPLEIREGWLKLQPVAETSTSSAQNKGASA